MGRRRRMTLEEASKLRGFVEKAERGHVTDRGDLRTVANIVLGPPRNESTLKQYQYVWNRYRDEVLAIVNDGQSVLEWIRRQPQSKSFKYQIKPALQYHLSLTTKEMLAALGQAERERKIAQQEGKAAHVEELEHAIRKGRKFAQRTIEEVLRMKPDYLHERRRDGECPAPGEGMRDGEDAKKRRRKKKKLWTLRDLPSDWREQVQLQLRDDMKMFGLVSAIIGPRPKGELERGIAVWIDDGNLVLHVEGIKRGYNPVAGAENGQAWRDIKVVPVKKGPLAIALADEVARYGQVIKVNYEGPDGSIETDRQRGLIIKCDNPHAWRKHFSRVAKRVLGAAISPVMYRHQVAADLKADPEVDRETMAKVMGHASDQTAKEHYGLTARGHAGGHGIVAVSAAQQVRRHGIQAQAQTPHEHSGTRPGM